MVDDIFIKGTPVPTGLCTPTSEDPQWVYIDDIRFMGTLNDVDNLGSGYSNGYQDFTTLPHAVQAQGEGMNIYYRNESYSGSAHVKAWVDWNKDGLFSPGELVYDTGNVSTTSASFGVIIPITTPPGDYRIRIRNNVRYDWSILDTSSYDFNSCEDFVYTSRYDNDGEAEDYIFTVIPACNANIIAVTDGDNCGAGTINLSVTGTTGTTGFKWYSSETGGILLHDDTTATGNWTTPSITTTTTYWVTAYNATCESYFRSPVTAIINPTPTVLFTPENPIICGEAPIQITAGGDAEQVVLIDENFEGGGLGLFTNNNDNPNGNPYDPITVWQNKTSPYIPNNTQVWSPAISSGLAGNHFVMSTSDVAPPGNVHQYLELTAPVDASNMTDLTLSYDMYYSNFGDEIRIQANDGTGWNTIRTYTTSVAIGTRFENQSINLPASYNGSNSLRIRIQFLSGWGDGVAIDNIKLFGIRPLNTAFDYDTATVDAFTDATCSTPYVPNTPATTIWIKPTLLQLENVTFTIPVSAVLSNGCTATGNINVTNNTKIFKSPFNDWNNDSNWSPPGVPTIDNCVIIPNGQESIVDGTLLHAEALNVTVKNGGILHLEPEYTLTVQDWINVENTGVFNIKNSASLIQINDLTTKPNSGNVHVQRAPKNDFSPVDNLNYVYWSSPVKGFNVGNISPNTSASLIWKWIPTIPGNGSGNHGDWQNATGTMIDGTGYIVRGLSGTPTVLPATTTIPVSNNTALFTGVPNNGEIVVPINRGNYTGLDYIGNGNTATAQDDNWNLLGNPYPSSISANAFVNLNSHISGTIYLWPHTALPSAANDDPFYGDYGLNYDNIYIEHNPTGTIPPTVGDLNIASGQAFMVLTMDTAGLSESVLFNNSLRDKSQANDNFYRQEVDTPEKHRIWLDLAGSDNKGHTLLVGYIANATNDYDRLYDGYNFLNQPTNFYSLIGESTYSIQGRALPFSQDDTIPLGFTISENDSFTIGINTIDGLFESTNQGIFLEDTYMKIIHDLRIAPYSFKSDAGTFNDRFILRYTNAALSIADQQTLNNLSITAPNNSYIKVSSANDLIKSVSIFDVLGRELFSNDSINDSDFILNNMALSKGTYVVKATLENGIQKVEKVILK